MPIPGVSSVSTGALPTIRVGELVFNDHGSTPFTAQLLEGWFSTAAVEAPIVGRGDGPGGRKGGRFRTKERYLTLAGTLIGDNPEQVLDFRSLLLQALPEDEEVALEVIWAGESRQAFVSVYDTIEIDPVVGRHLRFTAPLLQLDPRTYAATTVGGTSGVFTGAAGFRTYDAAGHRTYLLPERARTYTYDDTGESLPPAVLAESPGDVTSHRVVTELRGPLLEDDWAVVNETTGERLEGALAVPAGRVLTLDTYRRTAALDGAPVESFVFGQFPSLAPGDNTFRLMASSESSGRMTVQALPAYR